MSIIIYYCLLVPKVYRHCTIITKEVMVVSRKKSEKKSIEKEIFSFTEAQEFLGISHQTLYKLMEQGLPSHKIGKKRVFLKEDLLNWVKEH